MNRRQKVTAAAMTILTGIAVYCFFAFRYPYHLHFQEQYQLFESTWAYFCSVVSLPGGLADWAGRFLTQFFYYAPAGAALMALLLCAVQLLTWSACRRRTLAVYALSFLPAVLLLAYYCDENALSGGAVALGFSLGCASLCLKVNADRVRHILMAVLIPVLYMACGPLVVVFVLTTAIHEAKRGTWLFLGVMACLTVLCSLVASRIFPYPLGRLCFGIHYHRYHNLLPGLLWLSAFAALIPVAVSCLGKRMRTSGWIAGLSLFAGVAVLGFFLTVRLADASKEEWMRYDFMVRMQMWNRIMLSADRRNPDNPKTVSCLNLALAKTGRMADSQFEYFQNGPDGLLPSFAGDHTNPVSTGEIFWHLGMVNTAQRYAFEAQEAIPDFQKSARCYQRLAETNIVNGDWTVARKYLKALHNARFYRKWADETAALLDDGSVFEHRPELTRARNFRLTEHDFLFSDTEMDSMLGLLTVEHPENTLALDYLMAWCLLQKDLDRFVECIPLVKAPTMPQSYQEALLLHWALNHRDFDGLPNFISPANARRLDGFISDLRAGKQEAQMRSAYGDTYWFYYYYRYRTQ